MKTPHVTVCVPAYNASRTISRTIDSILAQDYPNFDVLVCDNSSSDDTKKIVKAYEEMGIKYVLNPVYATLGESNWNYVLSKAEGPLIALYHADDIYTPTMLRKQVEFLQANENVSSVFTMSQTIDDHDKPIRLGNFELPKEYKSKQIFSFQELFNAVLKYGTITMVPTMLTRKNVITKVGDFNWKKFHSAADIDLYLRMAKKWPIGIIDEQLHLYRLSAQQGTALINKSRTHLAHFFNVIDNYLSLNEVRKFVNKDSLKIYTMYRSADQVYCAINYVLVEKETEALKLLDDAISYKVFFTAINKPRQFIQIFFGVILKIGIKIGIGAKISQIGILAYTRYQNMRRKPIK
ncbi:MAG: glycosyltransferase [Desulfobacterales bacterium]|nr:glycosyltransferase [Desulfobacterales bacterium]